MQVIATDVGSDHKLVLAKLRLRPKTGAEKQELVHYNIDRLRDEAVREEFEQSIQKTATCQEGSNVKTIYELFYTNV